MQVELYFLNRRFLLISCYLQDHSARVSRNVIDVYIWNNICHGTVLIVPQQPQCVIKISLCYLSGPLQILPLKFEGAAVSVFMFITFASHRCLRLTMMKRTTLVNMQCQLLTNDRVVNISNRFQPRIRLSDDGFGPEMEFCF